MAPLFATLSEELLSRLAGVTPADVPSAPDAAPIDDPDRYCGTYALRNQVTEVTADGFGRLWLTGNERNEAATMAALAGEGLESLVRELRRADHDTFASFDVAGRRAGTVGTIRRGRRRSGSIPPHGPGGTPGRLMGRPSRAPRERGLRHARRSVRRCQDAGA